MQLTIDLFSESAEFAEIESPQTEWPRIRSDGEQLRNG